MSRLERFDYDPLSAPDRLRLLRLHPANSTQIEIDCTLFGLGLAGAQSRNSRSSCILRIRPPIRSTGVRPWMIRGETTAEQRPLMSWH
jgi:hypothetical protein